MQTFSEHMKALTDALSASKNERRSAVAGMKEDTQRALANARTSLQELSDEQRARAADCRAKLAGSRRERCDHMQAFRTTTRRELSDLRRGLHDMLGRCRDERRESLNSMLDGFHTAQQQMQRDFQAAARCWRDLVQRRPSGN